jgi:hypothetical protein
VNTSPPTGFVTDDPEQGERRSTTATPTTAPGIYTSPVFSGPTDDCDISINFLDLELD